MNLEAVQFSKIPQTVLPIKKKGTKKQLDLVDLPNEHHNPTSKKTEKNYYTLRQIKPQNIFQPVSK